MKQFWMVWGGDGMEPPKRTHSLETIAINEAERLARMNPGRAYVVLESTHVRKVTDMQRVDLREADDIPF